MKYVVRCAIVLLGYIAQMTAQAPPFRWAKGASGTGDDIGQSLALDTSRNCYVTGGFQSSPVSFDTDTLMSAGGYDILVVKIAGKVTAVLPEKKPLPATFALNQNYPNPFNPMTTISYQLATRSHVILKIFDILGREVKSLVNEVQEPGYRSVRWNTEKVPSGVYFYRMSVGRWSETRNMAMSK